MKTGNSQAKYCNYSLFTSLCLISPVSCLFDNKSYILNTVAQYEAGKVLVLHMRVFPITVREKN